MVAVADPDDTGRTAALQRAGARRGYADYRELLAREKPGLVCIAFRHPRRHAEVALAALEAGAHLFIEKPLSETLAEADLMEPAALGGVCGVAATQPTPVPAAPAGRR